MKEALFQSKCPECGNIDLLRTKETLKKVHCQRCYHHYDYPKVDSLDNIREILTSDINDPIVLSAVDELIRITKQARINESSLDKKYDYLYMELEKQYGSQKAQELHIQAARERQKVHPPAVLGERSITLYGNARPEKDANS